MKPNFNLSSFGISRHFLRDFLLVKPLDYLRLGVKPGISAPGRILNTYLASVTKTRNDEVKTHLDVVCIGLGLTSGLSSSIKLLRRCSSLAFLARVLIFFSACLALRSEMETSGAVLMPSYCSCLLGSSAFTSN